MAGEVGETGEEEVVAADEGAAGGAGFAGVEAGAAVAGFAAAEFEVAGLFFFVSSIIWARMASLAVVRFSVGSADSAAERARGASWAARSAVAKKRAVMSEKAELRQVWRDVAIHETWTR